MESDGVSFFDILEELNEEDFDYEPIKENRKVYVTPTLPDDCINLFDTEQISYYEDNSVVKTALKELKSRKLHIACNTPSAFYVSLTDFIHKNRLIIPFYDINNKIVHYQSRSILDKDKKSRYISKMNSEKTIFNINNVSSDLSAVYIFEGPLNSCFTPNGIAIAGIQEKSQELFSSKQSIQMQTLIGYDQIWVLDSQWIDSAARNKSMILADQGHNIFVWPELYGKNYKDFNDIAISTGKPKINPEFIHENTYSGFQAKIMLSKIIGDLSR